MIRGVNYLAVGTVRLQKVATFLGLFQTSYSNLQATEVSQRALLTCGLSQCKYSIREEDSQHEVQLQWSLTNILSCMELHFGYLLRMKIMLSRGN